MLGRIQELLHEYPALEVCRNQLLSAYEEMLHTALLGGTILVCGNGGSAADADHIVGELMKGFYSKRPLDVSTHKTFCDAYPQDGDGVRIADNLQGAIRAISLTQHTALISAFNNDCDPEFVYAQQVWGYGKLGDTLVAISTSGSSKNVLYAAKVAKVMGIRTVALTGNAQSPLSDICDVSIMVPSRSTHRIQELHLPIYHTLCLMLEDTLFPATRFERG